MSNVVGSTMPSSKAVPNGQRAARPEPARKAGKLVVGRQRAVCGVCRRIQPTQGERSSPGPAGGDAGIQRGPSNNSEPTYGNAKKWGTQTSIVPTTRWRTNPRQ